MRNAGSSSYIPNIPPSGFRSNFHINTVAPPAIIPAIAPALVVFSQNSEKSMIGPNVAPNPAQAKDTTLNMTLFSSSAINIATKDMQRSVILVTRSTALSSASLLISPWYMFLDKEEADNNRYESAELMIAANMPASTTLLTRK